LPSRGSTAASSVTEPLSSIAIAMAVLTIGAIGTLIAGVDGPTAVPPGNARPAMKPPAAATSIRSSVSTG